MEYYWQDDTFQTNLPMKIFQESFVSGTMNRGRTDDFNAQTLSTSRLAIYVDSSAFYF